MVTVDAYGTVHCHVYIYTRITAMMLQRVAVACLLVYMVNGGEYCTVNF